MTLIIQRIKSSLEYLKSFVKWLVIAGITGVIGGIIGSLFHMSIDVVTYVRSQNEWIVFLLPIGAVVIAFLYNVSKKFGRLDTNRILDSVRDEEKVPLVLVPLIFVSAVITHLVGGSAGREGAALQLGGAIGYRLGRFFRLHRDDMHIIVMSGMSAVFTALFGTPLAASVFAMEVTSVGVMYYSALLPCIFSSVAALGIAHGMGVEAVSFAPVVIKSLSFPFAFKVVVLSVLCAIVSIVFCTAIKTAEHYGKRFLPNSYLRALAGGILVLMLTLIAGTYDYNGAGMNVVERALGGSARGEAFLLKIIFTSITVAAGFKGGEIVPAFFVGSTFGCAAASLMGLDPSIGAAIGFVALFCGAVNCPIASILLALEVFGADSILMFAVVCAISYMMSGNYGLYKSQKILYSKLSFDYIDVNAG